MHWRWIVIYVNYKQMNQATKKYQVSIYRKENDDAPFKDWLKGLDGQAKARIVARIQRIEQGNFGEYKPLGDDVYELKYRFGPGYRAYYGQKDDAIVLLLCGGDKSTQRKDVKKAKKYWLDYKERGEK